MGTPATRKKNQKGKGHLTAELLTANKEPLGWCILNRPQVVHFNRPVRDGNFLHGEVGFGQKLPDMIDADAADFLSGVATDVLHKAPLQRAGEMGVGFVDKCGPRIGFGIRGRQCGGLVHHRFPDFMS
jgi:hypothetical protein